MSGEISVNTTAVSSPATDRSVANPPAAAIVPAITSSAATAGSSPAFPNPEIAIDPALGIAVLEFRDTAGTVVNSIPSQRQIDAYLQAQGTQNPTAPPAAAARG